MSALYLCGSNVIGAKAVLVDQARIDRGWAPLPTPVLVCSAALGGWMGGFAMINRGYSHIARDRAALQWYFGGSCGSIIASVCIALQHPVMRPVLQVILRR